MSAKVYIVVEEDYEGDYILAAFSNPTAAQECAGRAGYRLVREMDVADHYSVGTLWDCWSDAMGERAYPSHEAYPTQLTSLGIGGFRQGIEAPSKDAAIVILRQNIGRIALDRAMLKSPVDGGNGSA